MTQHNNAKSKAPQGKPSGSQRGGEGLKDRQGQQPKGMGGTDLHGEDSATTPASEESPAASAPADEKKVDDHQPGTNDIKKNPDPEPGVPDQDF